MSESERESLNSITENIIGCTYTVSNKLGHGFVEKVYENALAYEIKKAGFQVKQQQNIVVKYEDIIAGKFTADILVEGSVLVELKTVKKLDEVHLAQCLNYLKATGLRICLLINFGKPRIDIRRIVNNF